MGFLEVNLYCMIDILVQVIIEEVSSEGKKKKETEKQNRVKDVIKQEYGLKFIYIQCDPKGSSEAQNAL